MAHPITLDLQNSPITVLDTNVVLGWLVFRNPVCMSLGAAIESRRMRWIGTMAMRDELAHVLSRGGLTPWAPDLTQLWMTWDRCCQIVPSNAPSLLPRLKCTDPDDQKFIELALSQAQCLISKDRAVLKLSRRAALLGLHILSPECWAEVVGDWQGESSPLHDA